MSQHTTSTRHSSYTHPTSYYQYPVAVDNINPIHDWQTYNNLPSTSAPAVIDHHYHPFNNNNNNRYTNAPSVSDYSEPAGQRTWTVDGGETVYSDGNDGDLTLYDSRLGMAGSIVDSPILVSPERASDYAKMSMSSATPPPSNASVKTYLHRFVGLVRKIHRLPWVAPDRVTADFYPEKGKAKRRSSGGSGGGGVDDLYDRRDMHVIAVSWKSRDYIAWRQSNYGHMGGFSASPSEAGRTMSLAFSGGGSDGYGGAGHGSRGSGSNSSDGDGMTLSPESDIAAAAIIEPFPYTPISTR